MKRKSYDRNRRLEGQTQQTIDKRKKMNKMSVTITESNITEKEKVQTSGHFNLIAPRARKMTTIIREKWVQ